MRRVSVGFAAAVVLSLGSTSSASAQETLTANCGPPSEGPDVVTLVDSATAQTFVAQQTGPLTRAELELGDQGDPGDFLVEIQGVTATGEPNNVALAATVLPDEGVPTLPALVSAIFPNPALVVAGQAYALAFHRPDGGSQFGAREECVGSSWFTSSGGLRGSWTQATGHDVVFRAFVSLQEPGTCKGKTATLIGTEGDDEFEGTPERDVISAFGGKDKISGLAGKDLICGGKGKDTLRGGKGKDKLYGQKGKDKLAGGGGKDRCVGGKKDDSAKKCERTKSI